VRVKTFWRHPNCLFKKKKYVKRKKTGIEKLTSFECIADCKRAIEEKGTWPSRIHL